MLFCIEMIILLMQCVVLFLGLFRAFLSPPVFLVLGHAFSMYSRKRHKMRKFTTLTPYLG
jgi:hypothetical protein